MKKILNKFSCWLYKKTSPIPQRLECRFAMEASGERKQVCVIFTNSMLEQSKKMLIMDLHYRIEQLVREVEKDISDKKLVDLFGGKTVIETTIVPRNEIWINTKGYKINIRQMVSMLEDYQEKNYPSTNISAT